MLTEAAHTGEFLLSEAPGTQSRDNIVVAASQTLLAGQVLGKITRGASTAVGAAGLPAPAGATITAAPTASGLAKSGAHRFECIVGGAGALSKWRHTDPDGVFVGIATAGTVYVGGGLSALTITDAGTDPTVGEAFVVTVAHAAGSGRYVMHDPEATTGEEVAAGVLWSPVTTGAGETAQAVAIRRNAEVISARLKWDDQSAPEKVIALAELAAAGVIAR